LALDGFAVKTPGYDRWISLGFLGFSRPKRDFSMVYAGKTVENFSRAFSRDVRSATTGAGGSCMRNSRITHEESLTLILLFCKRLLSDS
jgi:hypothetical protein